MKLTLTERQNETTDIVTFIFTAPEKIEWKAGQYLHYTLSHENPDDRGTKRWFTISSAPFENHIQITTRHAEKSSTFKDALFNMKIGETIEGGSPEGEFILEHPEVPSIFIAGGIGITPFRSILLDLDKNNKEINVKLLYANRDENFIFKSELDSLAEKHPSFSIHYFVDPERIGEKAIQQESSDFENPDYFVSGPKPMVEAFSQKLAEMNIGKEKIRLDDFPGYEWTGFSEN